METTSTGNRVTDFELDLLKQRLASIEARIAGGQDLRTVTPQQPVNASGQIIAAEVDGDPYEYVDGIEFDQADGFIVTRDGNLGRVDWQIETTKGDLIVHDGTNPLRKAVGANGQLPFADSADTQGIKWKDPANVLPTSHPPFWRVRGYLASVGNNLVVDSSWFDYR